MARGEIPARRDAARAIDYRGAVRRKPICEFVERIDIKDRVDMADGIKTGLVAREDQKAPDLRRLDARFGDFHPPLASNSLQAFVEPDRCFDLFRIDSETLLRMRMGGMLSRQGTKEKGERSPSSEHRLTAPGRSWRSDPPIFGDRTARQPRRLRRILPELVRRPHSHREA